MVATTARSQKLKPGEKDPRPIVSAVNRVIEGRTDNYGQVTLTPNAASTVVEGSAVQFLSENSTILFCPRTAHAAAELAAGGMYVSSKGNRTFTIAHANNAQVDRTFDFSWHG